MINCSEFKVIDKVSMPHVLDFICKKLAAYDTTTVEWVKLLPLRKKAILHGCCAYPVRSDPHARSSENSSKNSFKSGYRLRASVNVEAPPPFVYQHWGRIPSNNHKQGWYSGARLFRFDDLEECAVHTLAHECFHFLSHSRQLQHKNTEANANWWADQWLAEFQT